MEEKTIKNIPAIPFSMMLGAVSGVIGFVVAVIIAIFWIPLIAAGNSSAVPGFGLLFGMGAIIMIIVIVIYAHWFLLESKNALVARSVQSTILHAILVNSFPSFLSHSMSKAF